MQRAQDIQYGTVPEVFTTIHCSAGLVLLCAVDGYQLKLKTPDSSLLTAEKCRAIACLPATKQWWGTVRLLCRNQCVWVVKLYEEHCSKACSTMLYCYVSYSVAWCFPFFSQVLSALQQQYVWGVTAVLLLICNPNIRHCLCILHDSRKSRTVSHYLVHLGKWQLAQSVYEIYVTTSKY